MTRTHLFVATLLCVSAIASAAPRVVVTAKSIELSEPVYFEVGKPDIKAASYPILDALAAKLTADNRIGLVEIQGHTDSRGADAYNLQISEKRAKAIETYLVDKGVSPKRLRAKGYGETRPLDKSNTAAAWAKNRRMAFVILQRKTI